MLIDEVDVMLANRATNTLVQIARITTFLSILEHNEGIIFLTDNMNLNPTVLNRCFIRFEYIKSDIDIKIQILNRHLQRYNFDCESESIDKTQKFQLLRDCHNDRQISFHDPLLTYHWSFCQIFNMVETALRLTSIDETHLIINNLHTTVSINSESGTTYHNAFTEWKELCRETDVTKRREGCANLYWTLN